MSPVQKNVATLSSTLSPVSPVSSVLEYYEVIKDLGHGHFGQVKEVKQKDRRSKHFAWKQVSLEKDPRCENEVQLLSELKHEGVVQMMDAYCQGGVVDILLELCSKGTMSQYVQKHFESLPGASKKVYLPPDVVDIKMAMRQLLKTLKYLHENHVAHRDVKPDNVLLASGHRWKLADFNLATRFTPGDYMVDHVGTRPFTAPEVPQHRYTEKCDIYSMGILLINLATGKHYWRPEDVETTEDQTHMEELLCEKNWVESGIGPRPLHFAKKLISLECERYDAEGALQNPWLMKCGAQAGCCTIS